MIAVTLHHGRNRRQPPRPHLPRPRLGLLHRDQEDLRRSAARRCHHPQGFPRPPARERHLQSAFPDRRPPLFAPRARISTSISSNAASSAPVNYRDASPSIPQPLRRLVWSESDGLPGVVVDRYGDTVVLQTLTLAMDQRRRPHPWRHRDRHRPEHRRRTQRQLHPHPGRP